MKMRSIAAGILVSALMSGVAFADDAAMNGNVPSGAATVAPSGSATVAPDGPATVAPDGSSTTAPMPDASMNNNSNGTMSGSGQVSQ